MTTERPITHQPHSFVLVFRHDCGVRHILAALCDEGRCNREITDSKIPRYAAIGVEMLNVPGFPLGNGFYWTHEDETLFIMTALKLALHEGRQSSIHSLRAKLVELARTRPHHYR